MDAISWLNKNQGFVMSILTLIYVVTTVLILVANNRSVKLAKEQAEKQIAPKIIIGLRGTSLCIRNEGESTAEDVKISIEETQAMIDYYNELNQKMKIEANKYYIRILSFLRDNSITIMPRQEESFKLADRPDFIDHFQSINVSYEYSFKGKSNGEKKIKFKFIDDALTDSYINPETHELERSIQYLAETIDMQGKKIS